MKRILIVDDLEQNRYLLEATLEGYGYQVDSARDGAEALTIARRRPPDLVISDILMPVMDGFALCRQWRADESLRAIPFVFYTATYTDPKDEQLALDLGADRFVLKPQEPQALHEIVCAVLALGGKPSERWARAVPPAEIDTLREYNEALVRKLEKKLVDLDSAHRQLLADTRRRELADAALHASEANYHALIEHMGEGLMLVDDADVIRVANPRLCRMLGYTESELLGQHAATLLLHQEDLVSMAERNRWRANGIAEGYETRLLRKSGETLWAWLSATPVKDAEGGFRGSMAIVADITERRQSEALSNGQKQVFEMIAGGAPLAATLAELLRVLEAQSPDMLCSVLLLDSDGQHLRHGAAPSLPDDYIRAVDGMAIGPSAGSCGTAAFRREMVIVEDIASDPLWQVGRALALRHGLRACWSSPIFDAQKKLLGTFAIYYRRPCRPTAQHLRLIDIATQTTAVAISHMQAQEAILAEKAFSDAMLDSLPATFCLFDQSGGMLRWNRAFETASGYAAHEIAVMHAIDFFAGEDRTAIEQYVRRVFETGASDVETALTAKDGSRTPHHFAGVRIAIRGVPCCISAGIDVTARKLLEEELLQAHRIEGIGRLAGGVAHDFNNIVGVILGYGELAQLELEPGNPVRERVQQMMKAAERAADLTRQLQAFSRKQILQPRILDLNTLVAEADKMLGRLIGEDIRLVVRLGPGLGTVKADPGQIEQIILNLAVNARDAMPRGGSLTLETANLDLDEEYASTKSPMLPGRYVLLAVSDTGAGMDTETQRRIFEPFFTTKPAGEGTGLGLATVYGIVKQSGGYIWVYSELGRGTTFKIYLPRVEQPGAAAGPTMAVAIAAGGDETILLVEDNQALRQVVQRRLVASGYTVLCAGDGEEALALARAYSGPIDLLLTDVVMPKLGGVDLALLMAGLRTGLRVVYMSGYTDGAILQHGVLEEGVVLIEKPFTGEKLVRVVRESLDRRAAG